MEIWISQKVDEVEQTMSVIFDAKCPEDCVQTAYHLKCFLGNDCDDGWVTHGNP